MSKKVHQRFLPIAATLSPALAEAIERVGPVRVHKRSKTPLPVVLSRAVAGQQLSVKAASTIWGRVCDSAKDRPLTEHLARARPATLQKCGLSAAKAKAIRAIAQAEKAGRLDPDALRRLDHPTRSNQLTAIWGVGPWTADMISMFYFGDPDVWPDGDVSACGTLQKLTSRRRKTTRTAEHFAPHRSYLAVYMWKHADAAPNMPG